MKLDVSEAIQLQLLKEYIFLNCNKKLHTF